MALHSHIASRLSVPRLLVRALPLLVLGVLGAARADVFVVAESTGDVVTRVNAAGVKTSLVATGLDDPQGVAVDAAGNLYVADAGSGRVLMFPAGGGPGVQVGDVLDAPSALAFDAAGVLHVATTGDDQVWKLVGPDFVPLASLPTGAAPRSLVFGPSGDLYTANEGTDTISEVTPAGGVSVFSDDVTEPWGLAFDATGKLHATDSQQGGRIVSFNPAGKAHAEVTGLGTPRSLGFDKAGDTYFLTAAGSLRRVEGNDSVEVASGLSGPAGLTVRAPELRVVASKGQAPGDPADATFASLGSPAVGGGFVAFKGKLQPGTAGVIASNAWGVWRADPLGELSLLARQNFPAPGVAEGVFASFGDPVLNADGGVAFLGKLASGPGGVTSADAKGVWADVDGTLTLVARQGDDAPGLAEGVRFASFLQLVLPDDAGPALLARVKGPGVSGANDVGLWSADETGALELVVREGDEVVVGADSLKLATLDLFETTSLSRGQSRHVASQRSFTFLAHFTSGARAVVMVQPGQAPQVLLAPGDAVGSALDPGSFAAFGPPCVSASATQFGFFGKLATGVGDITKPSAKAVFRQDAELELEARTTFGAPGTDGAVFSWLSDPVVNAANTLALLGKLVPGLGDAAGQAVGLWVDAGDGLQLVVRQADEAPGVKGAAFFKTFKQFVLPDAGGVVFAARLGGAGIKAGNDVGVWASDGVGAIELLLREGDTLDIDGAAKTVASLKVFDPAPGVTGQSRGFDHAGSVVVLAKCTDGTKAIVRCVPVP